MGLEGRDRGIGQGGGVASSFCVAGNVGNVGDSAGGGVNPRG